MIDIAPITNSRLLLAVCDDGEGSSAGRGIYVVRDIADQGEELIAVCSTGASER